MNVSASELSGNFSSSGVIYDLIQNNEMDIFRLSRKFVFSSNAELNHTSFDLYFVLTCTCKQLLEAVTFFLATQHDISLLGILYQLISLQQPHHYQERLLKKTGVELLKSNMLMFSTCTKCIDCR